MKKNRQTNVISFPFELFGRTGTAEGAEWMLDCLKEIVDDAVEEDTPARSKAYRDSVSWDEVNFTDFATAQSWRELANEVLSSSLNDNETLLWFGGNHLSVLPIYDYLQESDLILQWDAHLDIQEFSDNLTTLNHGNFLLSRQTPCAPIINLGHRDLLLPPKKVQKHFNKAYSIMAILGKENQVLEELQPFLKKSNRIWIDIDGDVFDPTFFPGVNYPLPFGISPQIFLQFLNVIDFTKVCGISISEFNPARDRYDLSAGLLAWLLEYILIRWHESPLSSSS